MLARMWSNWNPLNVACGNAIEKSLVVPQKLNRVTI